MQKKSPKIQMKLLHWMKTPGPGTSTIAQTWHLSLLLEYSENITIILLMFA